MNVNSYLKVINFMNENNETSDSLTYSKYLIDNLKEMRIDEFYQFNKLMMNSELITQDYLIKCEKFFI